MPHSSRVLQVSDLLPGDILYFRSLHPNPVEMRIAKKTGSPYTHVAIYLGEGRILHALEPKIAVDLLTLWLDDQIVAVARSQVGFGLSRVKKLNDFADGLIAQGAEYATNGKSSFFAYREAFVGNPFAYFLQHHKEVANTREDFESEAYFCSGLAVAAMAVVGIIDSSAQAAYPHRYMAPADLHQDPTFGWFVGYLIPTGATVPPDDPLRNETWHDYQTGS